MTHPRVYLGIDVAKKTLETTRFDRARSTEVPNTKPGVAKLVQRIKKLPGPVMVCCEATGGHELLLVQACMEAEIPVVRLSPSKVRYFARSKGILAKTDAIDAQVIGDYCALHHPEPLKVFNPAQKQLRGLVKRRADLVQICNDERKRLNPHPGKEASESIERCLKFYRKEIERLEQQINELLAHESELAELDDRFLAIRSVGPVLASSLLAFMPELGQISGKECAALAGVAPFNQDSGQYKGQRRIQGGRKEIRGPLYMAALVATTHNPILKDFYQGLIKKGKPAKVALTAVMRKLLILLNTIAANPDFKPA